MRNDIIQAEFPGIGPEDRNALVKGTSGMSKKELIEVVRQFTQTGERPSQFFEANRCPINPESNQYLEREFAPGALQGYLERFGMQSKWGIYFGNPELSWKVAVASKLCEFLAPVAQYLIYPFYVIAEKKA